MSILNYQQSHLDLNKIESINKNQMVDLMNNFLIIYVDKLKKLVSAVNSRLFDLNSKIINCESNLIILESRVASVGGLSDSKIENLIINSDNKSKTDEENKYSNEGKGLKEENISTDNLSNQDLKNDNVIDDIEEKNNSTTNIDISKYKKMLSFGVPLGAVKNKMILDGLDASLLD